MLAVLGLIVAGAIGAQNIHLVTPLTYTGSQGVAPVSIQTTLDGIFPGLIALTEMLSSHSSLAMPCVMRSSAAFVRPYTVPRVDFSLALGISLAGPARPGNAAPVAAIESSTGS